MIPFLIIIGLLLSIIKAFLAIKNIKRSQKLIDSSWKVTPSPHQPDVVIVIPVLREQKIIEETVNYFFSLNYPKSKRHLLLVTTEKEFTSKNKITTIDVIEKLKIRYPSLKTLHQPRIDGIKADQMNFAIEHFEQIFPTLNPKSTFFAFYDADSRPDKNILNIFCEVYHRNNKANVFQQSATYVSNFWDFDKKNVFEKYFLKAQALKQTRFILAYEIPRILRVSEYTTGRNKNILNQITYAPTIGHGLFVRVSLLKQASFPPNYTPEDMFWGFLLTSMKEPIVFIPSLDSSETPNSIKKVFWQLACWFKGPALSFSYKRFLKDHYPKEYQQNRIRANLLSLFAVTDAMNWLLTSFMMYIYIVGSLFFGWPVLLLFVVFLILYQAGIMMILNKYVKDDVGYFEKLTLGIWGIIILLFHSIPAYFSLANLLFGKKIFHKTER